MSLINKVINDLEDRQALLHKNESRFFRGLTGADNPNFKNRLLTARLFAVLLFLLASVSATYALMAYRSEEAIRDIAANMEQHIDAVEIAASPLISLELSNESIEETASMPVSTAVRTGMSENKLKLDFSLSSFQPMEVETGMAKHSIVHDRVTRIESIDISKSKDRVSLHLQVASAVDYRVYALSNPDRIVMEIDNAVFDGVLPSLGAYAGVSAIRLQQHHTGKLLLVIDTTKAYSVEDIELLPTTPGYALSLSILPLGKGGTAENNQQLEAGKLSSANYVEYGEMEKNINAVNEPGQARRMYIDARDLYRRGNIYEANDLLVALLQENAEHRAARTLLVRKLIEQGQLGEAEELLKAGLTRQVANSYWSNLYARLLVNKGNVTDAVKVLKSVTPDLSTEPDYYAFLAALYQKIEYHEDAVLTYRQVLQVRPGNGVWWMGLAISLESLERNTEALFAYNKALDGKFMSQDLHRYVQGKINYLNSRG